jgi:(heptosyl)LPS beta-1,4-glucosyltransferase
VIATRVGSNGIDAYNTGMADPLPLSGVVITFNEADRIERCLRSMLAVCRDVTVVDSQSTDGTPELARRLGARVVDQPWLGFGRQKNLAIEQATQPWVLLLDADEWLEPDAQAALRALFASGAPDTADVFTLPRRTHFLGTVMRFGSFAHEPVHRLFRAHCRHEESPVHERFITDGLRLRVSDIRMEHDTARSEAEYWAKLQRYAGLWAKERAARGKRAAALRGPAAAFAYLLKNLLLRGGLLDGPGAWRFHALHARYAALKYERLRALGGPQPFA